MMKWVTKSWPIANGIPNGNAIANGNICKQHIGKDIENGPEKGETYLVGRGWVEGGGNLLFVDRGAFLKFVVKVQELTIRFA